MAMAKTLPCHELTHLSDFDALLSSDDYISICGYGSLLSGNYYMHSFMYHIYPIKSSLLIYFLLLTQREVPEALFPTSLTSESPA